MESKWIQMEPFLKLVLIIFCDPMNIRLFIFRCAQVWWTDHQCDSSSGTGGYSHMCGGRPRHLQGKKENIILTVLFVFKLVSYQSGWYTYITLSSY